MRKRMTAAIAAGVLALSGCSAGSLGSSDDDSAGGKVTLSFLVDNGEGSSVAGRATVRQHATASAAILVRIICAE